MSITFHASGRASRARYLSFLLAGGVAVCFSVSTNAALTPAGTQIRNTAKATYGPSNEEVPSNEVVLTVDELLDVSVASLDASGVTVVRDADAQVLSFTVKNDGNGPEAFNLTAVNNSGDNFDVTNVKIYIDDGDNVFDAQDTLYVNGTEVLDPEETIKVFVVADIPATGSDEHTGEVNLKAAAKTGTGLPGTVFADQGQGGGDAVAGATGADGDDDGYYILNVDVTPPDEPDPLVVDVEKSAAVADELLAGGTGTAVVPGSTITYTITAALTGDGTATNLKITDAIPANTTYVAGSLKLGSTTLTDVADTDSGKKTNDGIEVDLGNVTSPATKTVSFKVKIDNAVANNP